MIIVILSTAILLLVGLWCLVFHKYACGIFNLIWSGVFSLCREDLCQRGWGQTQTVLLLMIAMVNFGCALGDLPVSLAAKARSRGTRETKTFCGRPLLRLLGLVSVIFLVYALRSVAKFGFDLQLVRSANNSDSGERVLANVVDTVLFYGVAMPMVYVGALCAAYNLSQGIRTPRSIYALLAVDLLLYVLTAGGRSMLIRVALFFAAALIWRLKNTRKIRLGRIARVCLAAGALLALLEIMTSARNSGDISFLNQAVLYVRGAVSHMRYQLARVPDHGAYAGYITYGGFLYYPVKILSRLFGPEWQTSGEIMAFLQEYKYIWVGARQIYYNALVPNAFYYYYDSGYAGVALFSLFLGIGTSVGERGCRRPGFLRFVLWATAVYAIVYSPLGGVLWAFRYPTALMYCVLLRNRLYRPAEPA